MMPWPPTGLRSWPFEGGATALYFLFEKNAGPYFDRLLDGIFLDMISLNFTEKSGGLSAGNFFPQFQDFLFSKKIDPQSLRGSMSFSGETPNAAVHFSEKTGGRFRTAGFAADARLNPTEQLEGLLKQAIFFIETKEKQAPHQKIRPYPCILNCLSGRVFWLKLRNSGHSASSG